MEGSSEEELEAAYRNIWEMIETEHILQISPDLKFVKETDETLRDLLRYDLRQVILELTEQCNMRCRYCIYNEHNEGYRNFSPKAMTWEVAKRAVEYAPGPRDRTEGVRTVIQLDVTLAGPYSRIFRVNSRVL